MTDLPRPEYVAGHKLDPRTDRCIGAACQVPGGATWLNHLQYITAADLHKPMLAHTGNLNEKEIGEVAQEKAWRDARMAAALGWRQPKKDEPELIGLHRWDLHTEMCLDCGACAASDAGNAACSPPVEVHVSHKRLKVGAAQDCGFVHCQDCGAGSREMLEAPCGEVNAQRADEPLSANDRYPNWPDLTEAKAEEPTLTMKDVSNLLLPGIRKIAHVYRVPAGFKAWNDGSC